MAIAQSRTQDEMSNITTILRRKAILQFLVKPHKNPEKLEVKTGSTFA